MKHTLVSLGACVALTATLLACGTKTEATDPRFEVAFQVNNDDGEPLAGATLTTGSQELGVTAENGRLRVRLKGREGQTLPITVSCPEGYQPPAAPSPLRLAVTRKVGEEEAQPIGLEMECTRRARDIVLVVHAERGGGVPVHVGGVEQTTTDGYGNAHVVLTLDKDARSLNVALDTSERPDLKPQNPTRTFELNGRDTLVVFNQEFVATPKPPRRTGGRASPGRHIPYKVD